MEYSKTSKQIEYIVDGFYKSGTIKLIENEDELTAVARYDEQSEIDSLYDLVSLNHEWWIRSKDRFDGWKEPDLSWLPFF